MKSRCARYRERIGLALCLTFLPLSALAGSGPIVALFDMEDKKIPGDGVDDYTIVPRAVARQMQSVDPESVRFLNPEAPPDNFRDRGGRRPFKRNNY